MVCSWLQAAALPRSGITVRSSARPRLRASVFRVVAMGGSIAKRTPEKGQTSAVM
jgi:hypothetical protein